MGTEIMQRLTLVRMSKFCGIKLKKSKLINEVGALSTTLPSSNQSALTGTKDTKLFRFSLLSFSILHIHFVSQNSKQVLFTSVHQQAPGKQEQGCYQGEEVFFHRQVVVLCQGYCGIIGWAC